METTKTAVLIQRSTILEPARLPNLITVAADVLAGYWIANGMRLDAQLLWLLLGAPAVYAAGYALNDYCNGENDSMGHRIRPIPSGRMEPWKALILSFALFTIGLTASALAGGSAPAIMIPLILSVLLYNLGTRERPFVGPMNMAGCRSLNLILGMGVPFWLGGFPNLYFPVFSFFYVFLLGCLGRFEVGKKMGEMTILALLGWAHLVTILLSISFNEAMSLENLPFLALFAGCTGPALLKAGQSQDGFAAETALKMMVFGIPLLNAVFCAGIQGFAAGVPVALAAVLAYLLPADFRLT